MPRASCVVFIRTSKNKRQFLFQHRAVYLRNGGNVLGLVQGSIDPGERSIQAAYREACEEASLNEFIDFATFQKYARRITKDTYNCYVFDITPFKHMKKWVPKPQKKFAKEMAYNVWKTGHFWINQDVLALVLKNDLAINRIKIWDRTRSFLIHYWVAIWKN